MIELLVGYGVASVIASGMVLMAGMARAARRPAVAPRATAEPVAHPLGATVPC